MKLRYYLATVLLWSYFTVVLILITLFGVIELVDQLDEVGKGRFSLNDALLHALLVIPRRVLDLTPVAILLGTVLALNQLSQHSELIAMQAAGISKTRFRKWILSIVAIGSPLLWLAEEFIAPPLDQFARHRQAIALQGDFAPGLWGSGGFLNFINLENLLYGAVPAQIDLTEQGLWARSDHQILHIHRLDSDGQPLGIDLYILDNSLKLVDFFRATRAVVSEEGVWTFYEVLHKSLGSEDPQTHRYETHLWSGFIDLRALRATAIRRLSEPPPQSLSLSTLWQLQNDLAEQGKPTTRVALAFWQKLGLPWTALALTTCALAFATGTPRDSGGGRRLVYGALLGIGFYLGNQILAGIGIVAQWPAPLIAFLPTLLLLLMLTLWFKLNPT